MTFDVEAMPHVTTTPWFPAAKEGAVQFKRVSETTTTLVHACPLIATEHPLMNPVPVMFAVKPPAVLVSEEVAPVTVGATYTTGRPAVGADVPQVMVTF